MIAVLDTNVLVSALWTPNGKAAYIVNQAISGRLKLCHDYRILAEYREVLSRLKFKFSDWQINFLLERLEKDGISFIPTALPHVPFTDKSDRIFYEVAKFCGAPLVTGNLKHYPQNDSIIFPSERATSWTTCGSNNIASAIIVAIELFDKV